jgi:hypothetical protein
LTIRFAYAGNGKIDAFRFVDARTTHEVHQCLRMSMNGTLSFVEFNVSYLIVILGKHEKLAGKQIIILLLKISGAIFEIIDGNLSAVFEHFF